MRHSKAVAEVIPEADGLLGTGFHKPEEGVAGIAACVRTGAGGDLAARDLAADVVFRTVGMQRDLRVFQHREQTVLLGAEPCQQPVQGDKARLRGEDGVEAAREPGCAELAPAGRP